LEAETRPRGDIKQNTFQYLKGAIGSPPPGLHGEHHEQFQYLKGAIGRLTPSRRQSACMTISIPQRCDWKALGARDLAEQWADFNTSKVRLEAVSTTSAVPCRSYFNTSKVRLEAERPEFAERLLLVFQYLKGAIGRVSAPLSACCAASFQYLKGAIGSREVKSGESAQNRYFNTSKVRLEVYVTVQRWWGVFHFNTSKVRLEESHRPERLQR